MPQDRMLHAIGRIERALARLENIDLSQPSFSSDPSDLQQRHDQLKQEAQAALSNIDRLIAHVKG
jgi:hypothetical protein